MPLSASVQDLPEAYRELLEKTDFEPKSLLAYFFSLCAIPHGSSNEAGVADALVRFAEARHLEYYRDEVNNVLIRKPGNPTKKPILLQGHTDMVCEKEPTSDFDFLHDSLRLKIKNGKLSAESTTLGGDDGVAVAIMLSLLDAEDESLPPISCLFTVGEEVGMTGAFRFDYSRITEKTILNIDSEEEGVACASCAGGADFHIRYDYDTMTTPAVQYDVTLSGLAGGHSGSEIDKCRANAVVLLGRILEKAYEEMPFALADMQACGMRNAIPRTCRATLACPDPKETEALIQDQLKAILPTLAREDRHLRVRFEKTKTVNRKETVLTFRSTSRVLSLLTLLPNGVISVFSDDRSLVEASSNLATVSRRESQFCFDGLARSGVGQKMTELRQTMTVLCRELGMKVTFDGEYPGWPLRLGTPLQTLYQTVYRDLTGKNAAVTAIHAGLECGIMTNALGDDVDCISIGPNLTDIHTPKEALCLSSFAATYRLIYEMLRRI